MRSEDPLAFLDEIQVREPNQAFFDILRGYPALYTMAKKTDYYLEQYDRPVCSISGGSDSDVMMDLVWRLDMEHKVRYAFFDTGIEMQATKDHISFLEKKYGVTIYRIKPKTPVGAAVRKYGYPFWTKQVSEYMKRLQQHGFKWEDEPFEILLQRYPNCKAALRWWCNEWGESSRLNISKSAGLKEYIIANPPKVLFSPVCCDKSKKEPAAQVVRLFNADITLIGVRKFEGGVRSTAYSSCFIDNKHKGAQHFPLFWLTDEDKRTYEQLFGVTHSDAYTKYGCSRTGCAGCPFGSRFQSEIDMLRQHEPKLAKAVETIFAPAYEYTLGYREFREQYKKTKRANTGGSSV